MQKLYIPVDKVIAFHPMLAKMLGSIEMAIYLQQMIYWSDKGIREDGWIYKTKEDFGEETTLSRFQQDKCRKKLEEMGLLETNLMKANGAPVVHYRLHLETLQEQILSFSTNPLVRNSLIDKQETYQSISKKLTNPLLHRIQAENTAEYKQNSSEFAKTTNPNVTNPINEVIELFKQVDPTYTKYFRNKTERSACEDLLKTFSLEEIRQRVDFVPKYNKVPYVNSYSKIYKPSDLLRNWVVMQDNMTTYRNARESKIKEVIM